MKIKEEKSQYNKNTLGQYLFLVTFALFYIKYIADASELLAFPSFIDNLIIFIILFLILTKLIIQRYTLARLITTMLILLIVIASSMIAKTNNLYMLGVMLLFSMQDVDLTKILKLSCVSKFITIVVHIFWYIVVYITQPSAIHYVYRGGSTQKRHYFFLGHANMFTAFVTWMFLEFIYIYYKKINMLHLSLIFIITAIFYNFTDSNTGIIIISIVIILTILDKYSRKPFDNALTVIARYGHIFCSIIFPILAVIYTKISGVAKTIWQIMDDAFSHRIWIGAYAYETYGSTFFGRMLKLPKKVYWDGRWFDSLQVFDNYYLGNFLSYGSIHLILISLGFFLYAPKMQSRDKIMIIAFIFYGAMEAYVTNIIICFALLLIGKYMYLPTANNTVEKIKPFPLWKNSNK